MEYEYAHTATVPIICIYSPSARRIVGAVSNLIERDFINLRASNWNLVRCQVLFVCIKRFAFLVFRIEVSISSKQDKDDFPSGRME